MFQENRRTVLSSLFHFQFFTSQPAPTGAGLQGGGGRCREDMASGGKGFGTEKITYGGSDTFPYKSQKIKMPIRNFFRGSNLPTC